MAAQLRCEIHTIDLLSIHVIQLKAIVFRQFVAKLLDPCQCNLGNDCQAVVSDGKSHLI